MRRDVGADLRYLLGEVAQEGCGAVGRGRVVEADKVGVSAGVGGVGKGGDGAEAIGFVAGNCEW